jgi:hypothetical protein
MRTARIPATLSLWYLLCLPQVVNAQAQGQVTDQAGKPLSGVHVWSGTAHTETDAAGLFDLDEGKVIGFSKLGYRPHTTLRADLEANPIVVLQAPTEVWRAPKCPAALNAQEQDGGFMFGRHMRFVVPRALVVQSVSDSDYWQNIVCIANSCLEHGWGGMWSGGYLVHDLWLSFFSKIREMTEREMYDVPHDTVIGEEYRGSRTDGTFFRWAGVLNESIGYDSATQSQVDVFDKVIDSLCWF